MGKNSKSSGVTAAQKHEIYYFGDGNIVFLVDNTLFRLYGGLFGPRYLESTDNKRPGEHDNDPIHLEGITAQSFSLFIRWVVANSFALDVQGRDSLTFPELKPLFLLAIHFRLDTLVTSIAITIMKSKPDESEVAYCLSLASEHPSIFPLEYRDRLFRFLCERQDCLTDQEADLLGARTTASIGRWRLKLNSRAISETAAFMPRADGQICLDKSPKFEQIWDASQKIGYWKISAV